MSAMPGGGDYLPSSPWNQIQYVSGNTPVLHRQWYAAKTTGDKLDLVFQNIVDNDGAVETVTHLGARDFIVFWSKQVER